MSLGSLECKENNAAIVKRMMPEVVLRVLYLTSIVRHRTNGYKYWTEIAQRA